MDTRLVLLAIGAIIFCMVIGIILYSVMEVKVSLLLIGSIVVPFYIMSAIIFFALWSANDYYMFKEPAANYAIASSETRQNIVVQDIE